MDLTVSRDTIARVLSAAAAVAAKRSPISALTCAVLDASMGRLTVRSTDLMVGLESICEADVKAPGRCAVSADAAAAIVNKLPHGDVRLKLGKAGKLEIASGKARFNVGVMPEEGFPSLPSVADAKQFVALKASDLLRGLAQGSYAAFIGDARPEIATTYVEAADGKLTFASTDGGKRMAVAVVQVECTPAQILLPTRGVGEVKKLATRCRDGEVAIAVHESNVFFTSGTETLQVKVNDAKLYPPWKNLLTSARKQQSNSATIAKDALSDAVKRVSLVSGGEHGAVVTLTFAEGGVRVSADTGTNDGADEVQCDATFEDEVSVVPDILLDALAAVSDDDVRIAVAGARGPILIEGATSFDHVAVCMPRSR